MTAAARWKLALEAWAIPEEILASAPESPYGFPTEVFRRRAEASSLMEPTPSARRALEALPEGGTVLDVGVGAGATSLPLAGRASRITGVDQSEGMLAAFLNAAETAGVASSSVQGTWPEVAGGVDSADVVVCGHVLYNVQDLSPFVEALTNQARRRVVVEITDRHPWAWMNDLWVTFHGIERPSGPTAGDAAKALAELGVDARRQTYVAPPLPAGFDRREDAVALVRRRLCLTADRDREIAGTLGERLKERDGLWSAGPAEQRLVTLWWDGAG